MAVVGQTRKPGRPFAASALPPVAEVADASGPVQDRADVLGVDGLP
jgi:hypothetical protein